MLVLCSADSRALSLQIFSYFLFVSFLQDGDLGLGNHFVECRSAGFLPRQTRGSGIVYHVCVCMYEREREREREKEREKERQREKGRQRKTESE